MCILQGHHRVFVVHHDSCDGQLDVSTHMIGLVGWISQLTGEPRFEAAQRQEVSGLVFKITEPAFGHPTPDDLSFEAFVVHLKEVKAVANISETEPKRVTIFEQDSFQSSSIRQTRSMN